MAFELQPSTTTARAGQANTGGIRGQVRGTCGAKVGATDGNDGKYTKVGIDYDRQNLIWGGSAVGHQSGGANLVILTMNELNYSTKFLDGLRGLAAFYVCMSHANYLLFEGYKLTHYKGQSPLIR